VAVSGPSLCEAKRRLAARKRTVIQVRAKVKYRPNLAIVERLVKRALLACITSLIVAPTGASAQSECQELQKTIQLEEPIDRDFLIAERVSWYGIYIRAETWLEFAGKSQAISEADYERIEGMLRRFSPGHGMAWIVDDFDFVERKALVSLLADILEAGAAFIVSNRNSESRHVVQSVVYLTYSGPGCTERRAIFDLDPTEGAVRLIHEQQY